MAVNVDDARESVFDAGPDVITEEEALAEMLAELCCACDADAAELCEELQSRLRLVRRPG